MHKDVNVTVDQIEKDDIIALCIILVRYIIQLVRFSQAVRENQDIRKTMKQSEIQLDNFKPADLTTDMHIDGQDYGEKIQEFQKQQELKDDLESKSPRMEQYIMQQEKQYDNEDFVQQNEQNSKQYNSTRKQSDNGNGINIEMQDNSLFSASNSSNSK